jgi:hypothetical protein
MAPPDFAVCVYYTQGPEKGQKAKLPPNKEKPLALTARVAFAPPKPGASVLALMFSRSPVLVQFWLRK